MIRGVRGATTVPRNTEEEILHHTYELLVEMVQQNEIKASDVASVFISTTEDVNNTFPARALRKLEGWTYVPVMCMNEIAVPGSLPMCIRVMIHVNTNRDQRDMHHIYHHQAVKLRPDLTKS
ncbi:chorismate mutase [Pontibacillus litoralis]|uniref:chorismate mutase n=1 Tax=Pontibacillus litoralis JSM 072002 TaxID=1385512 RepID=A0A0A5GA14_9BACI|nr:chorismate mutase [Pontibacillus litoralis]KGX87960.1 chorismate mutase [Pontibacillus litoralis JSM 072002]